MYNTASQQNVINYPYKPNTILKVVAGPGSGKTQTLLMKIKKMIQNDELLPHQILILSLTNKAIDNIVSNLSKLSDDSNGIDNRLISLLNIHTVHSLANKIVEYNEGAVDIIEDNGWRGLLKLIPGKATGDGFFINNNNNTKMNPRTLERLIQNFKNGKYINHNKKMGEILRELTEILNTSKVYTNDDLIIKASKYLQKNQYPLIHNDIKLVLIDEYQDLYPLLTPFIRSLMMNQDNTPNDKQLIIFGDINQSIYEFLGNNKQVIDELVNMPGYTTDIIHLEDNFRSSKEIVEYSRLCKPFKNATLDKKTHDYHNKPESGTLY
ncbi:uncharacterized protein SCODWIG_02878 [Saccharomycodes ludwigii]|uniref:UvrD-like helicase ATP-binding domain-containing protein n=1 Tax=Saccharomycodes ludwigii TaxID=36035 RepID=A0A376B8Y7_9ASCO|nr:uncharacterized protein SCODWIG_02878 [Saccharomycodes ludwigii]